MKRRDFLRSVTALAAGSALPAPAIWSPAKAQSRQETLLIVSESGPNNIDIHGVGTNVPGYEVSWNCYDRLISHEMKTVNGTPYYDRDKFKMELADDMKIGDMSVTFKLKKNATFHDGTQVTAKDVKWSLDRAVTVGGFPTFQMGAGSLTKAEQFVVVDDSTIPMSRTGTPLPLEDSVKNMAVLDSILDLRYRLARLIGFTNYADYDCADKMVGSAQNASDFIHKVVDAASERL